MPGITGQGTTPNDIGVLGESQEAEGVRGVGHKGAGVSGTSEKWIGTYGESQEAEGVRGVGHKGAGVSGTSEKWIGTYGESQEAEGVRGVGHKGAGVSGTSEKWHGVAGQTASTTGGAGVFGKGGLAGLFEGNVTVTGELVVQRINFSALIDRLRVLEQRIAQLEHQQNPGGSLPPTGRPQIGVTSEGQGQATVFIVSGFGFLPNKTITVRVVDDQIASRSFQQTSDASGKLNLRQGISCTSGLGLNFLATDSRQDQSDLTGVLWSNTVRTTCP